MSACVREREGETAWFKSWQSVNMKEQQHREAKSNTTAGVLHEGGLTIARTMAKHASLRHSKPDMQNYMNLQTYKRKTTLVFAVSGSAGKVTLIYIYIYIHIYVHISEQIRKRP